MEALSACYVCSSFEVVYEYLFWACRHRHVFQNSFSVLKGFLVNSDSIHPSSLRVCVSQTSHHKNPNRSNFTRLKASNIRARKAKADRDYRQSKQG